MTFASLKPLGNFFQHGYVTNDFDRALAHFADYGVTRFTEMRNIDIQVMGDRCATLSVALGYYGPLQIEVIQPEGGECQVHRDGLPQDGFALRLHHHGFLLHDEQQFFALRESYAARGAPACIEGHNPRSGNRYFYADTRAELGHYIEYIYMSQEGARAYSQIPQNEGGSSVPRTSPGSPSSRPEASLAARQ